MRREAKGLPPKAEEVPPLPPGFKPGRADYIATCREFFGWPAEHAGREWDRQWGEK